MYKESVAIKTTNKELEKPEAPVADRIKTQLTKHGHIRNDFYYWMNDINNPKVIEYLKSENEYTKQKLAHTEGLQKKLFSEIVGRIKKEDESVPYKYHGYFYYRRYEGAKEYPVYYRKKGMIDVTEEIMLDVNEMAKGHKFINVVSLNVSPDNKLLAFGVDYSGRRKYEILFKNLETGELLQDKISNTSGSSAWANDNTTIFYSKVDSSLRSYKIFKHLIGVESSKDSEVYHEVDPTFSVYINKSKSGKYIFIGSFSNTATEYRYIDADNPNGVLKLINAREKNHEYYVEHLDDKFLITTNDDAKNFKLVEAGINNPSKENWKLRIPHRKEILLEGIEVFKNFIAILERRDGLKKIRILDLSNETQKYIEFEEDTYSIYPTSNYDYESKELRFVYSSLTTPDTIYDFNMETVEKKILKEEKVVGNFNKENYISERIFAYADDGTKIPISIVYKKGLIKDGKNPLLLTGYGAYGISSDPDFSSTRLSLLDRGFIFAIAHIRGGQEFGRPWYESGKLLNKKNTFTDFISCADTLIKNNYTSKEYLFAIGGSAGGLLIGATINLRPDLFKGVIAAVPFVDVLTTMLDDSIPLTTGEYDEWGNPNKKEFYEYILSYSPYDNVERKKYPAILVTTGLNDSQVQYWEPAKWVAKLRDMKLDDNLLLFHANMSAGHSGASGRFERYTVVSLEYAFILDQLGIE